MKNVLVVAAHPDDAEIAMGGTIAKLVSVGGAHVTCICLTISEFSEHNRQRRKQAAIESSNLLGFNLKFIREGELDQVEQIPVFEIVRELDSIFESLRPDTIFTHSKVDSHFDHVLTNQAVEAATRRRPVTLYTFPPNEVRTSSFSSFVPNTFFDISDFIDSKEKALECFNYPLEDRGFRVLKSESYRNIAASLGALIGVKYAEQFCLVRQILG